MKYFKYFIQFLLTILCFIIFKILGPNISSNISGKIFEMIGPYFRSKKIIKLNIKKAFPNINMDDLNKISSQMWNNYGRVFAEFMFIKEFRFGKLSKKIEVKGQNILDDIISSRISFPSTFI